MTKENRSSVGLKSLILFLVMNPKKSGTKQQQPRMPIDVPSVDTFCHFVTVVMEWRRRAGQSPVLKIWNLRGGGGVNHKFEI
jgi:hypothetical protein